MSQADQDAIAGRTARERKNLQQQLAAIETELSSIRGMFAELHDKLKNDLDWLSRNFSPESFDAKVSKLPDLLNKYRKAREEEQEKAEQLRKMGLD